jgi:hypothetical protein
MCKPGKRRGALQRRTIEDEIAHLRDLDLKGLRAYWHNEFGRPAPEHLTRYLLFRSGRVYRIVEAKPLVSSRKAAVAAEQPDV